MTHDTCIIRTASVPRWSSKFSLPHEHAAVQELRSNTQAPPVHDRWAADDQRPPRATNSDHCQLGRPLYIALLPVAFRPRPALDDPLLKYGGLKSGHPQQMERASTMFMSTRQAIEQLRLATDSPSMRTVRSALDGQDRTASTGCLWQGDRQA